MEQISTGPGEGQDLPHAHAGIDGKDNELPQPKIRSSEEPLFFFHGQPAIPLLFFFSMETRQTGLFSFAEYPAAWPTPPKRLRRLDCGELHHHK